MTFNDFIKLSTARVVSTEIAGDYVGGYENLRQLEAAGWVKPIKKNPRATQYDLRKLDLAIDRANIEGWPKPTS